MRHVTYDQTADALYFQITDRPVAWSTQVCEHRVLDFDASGTLVGVEVFCLSEPCPADIAEPFGTAELLKSYVRGLADIGVGRFTVFESVEALISDLNALCEDEGMAKAENPELDEVAEAAGKCLACGEPPARVVARYPNQATVACAEGHQWEVEVAEKE